ncbi:hypothetical protein X777_10261 [Ooceraea biroi]|uniref:GIY-YIG domain-containing protein n=1 Tax=Ooceraea biroi TaxID=2015173 RepID=A0A026W6E3_OOCBI|nr:hypothetical protein X777_10261 [Ooceraea biroi]
MNTDKTDVVYRIQCHDCDCCYVGQTKRHLSTRIKEHRMDIKKHVSDHSVVSKHRTNENHDFDWNNVQILHQDKHFKKREIAEMCFIKSHDSTINLQRDTEKLPCIYDIILKRK